MANLSILSGIEFYSYDVEVYDKVLLGTIRYKDSQIAKFKNIDKTFFENKSFYGINRVELIREFVKYLSKFDSKIDKDSFLLGDVTDKRIKKGTTYVNDSMIFMASSKQYNAQDKSVQAKVETPKEVLKLDMEYKDKIYKVRLNLEELGIGSGQKILYDFNETMLKSKVESFLKSYKKDYDVQLSLQDEFVQVGKLLIDVTVYNDHVEGFVDLSSLNLDGVTSIQAEGKDKQELLNNIIQQLKAHKLTGKLNWGKVVDKTKKEGENKMANETTTATLKKLVKNLATMVKKVGFDEEEIDGRIMSIIPNAKPEGVGVGGNKVDLSYTLPWVLDKNQVKKKKFAEEVAETAQSNIVIKEVGLTLYILDEVEGEINISISADVKWINTFFGTTELDSYTLVEQVVPIQEATPVEVANDFKGNLAKDVAEFLDKEGTFQGNKFTCTKGLDAGLDLLYLNDKVTMSIRLFPSASQDVNRVRELNMMKDALRTIDNFPSDNVQISKKTGDDAISVNVTIAQFESFAVELVNRIKFGLQKHFLLRISKGVDTNASKIKLFTNSGGGVMASNLLLQEFVEKIASRPEVKLVVKVDKDTPFPVSFDVQEKGFEKISVRFENNASQYRASFRLDGPFSELQSKTFSFFHFLKGKGFGVTQEGLGVVVKGAYKPGDITIIHDLATLLDTIKGFSYNHANSFEAWAKKHKYGYSEANAFYQVRDIIPNYEGDAIVYKSGKSNFIAIPNDVEGIDGFLDAVKHAYTPEKSGAFYRFYFTNLDMMQDFVDFANKIDKPVKEEPSFAKTNANTLQPDKQDLGGVAHKSLAAEFNDHDLFINSDTFKTVKNLLLSDGFNQTDINGYVSFIKDNTQHGYSVWIRLRKNNKFDAHITVANTDHLKVLIDSLKGLKFTKTDDLTIKFANDVTFSKIMVNSILNIIKKFDSSLDVFTVANTPQPDKQDLGGVKPNNTPIEPSKEKAVIGKSYLVKKGDIAVNIVPFEKGQFYDVTKVTKGLVAGEDDLVDNYRIQVLSILKSGKIKCKNITLGYEFKINNEPSNVDKTYTLVDGNSEAPKVKEVSKVEEEPVKAPKEEVEPPNREVERTFKASKVKDPDHKEQLNRIKAYVKKIADVVDADNDFALRFLEEPKEFQKYKLPTVGLGLFYYGDKSATELEQNALYKKVYRGRGLSILRKFFKTTDLNGEKCLLVLFVDAQYAKETKAKLIKESFELGNKVRINGRLYKVNAIYEHKFAIETIAGLMYIDMDSDLIDITIEED